MRIEAVSESKARQILSSLGLPVVFWATQHMDCGKHQATICDYSSLKEHTVRFAIGIYNNNGDLVRRLNVMKG